MAGEIETLFATSSLRILRPKSLEILSRMLDKPKLLMTEDGKLRDYRGLAVKANMSHGEMKRFQGSGSGGTRAVVARWCQKDAAATVADLLETLKQMDRYDVAEDVRCLESLTSDCRQAASQGVADGCAVSDTRKALTMQDLEALRHGHDLPMYDAMIIHGEEEVEARFAWDLADRIEKAGKTVFLPDRDLIAGTIEHSASVDIICERCDKVITLFSPSFMDSPNSPKNKLYTDLAQYKSLEKKIPVLIPVILKRPKLPPNFTMISKLYYDPSTPLVNFYVKLYLTLGVTDTTDDLKTYLEEFSELSTSRRSAVTKASSSPRQRQQSQPQQQQQQQQQQRQQQQRHISTPQTLDTTLETTSSTRSLELLTEMNTTSTLLSTRTSTISESRYPEVPTHEPGAGARTRDNNRRRNSSRSSIGNKIRNWLAPSHS